MDPRWIHTRTGKLISSTNIFDEACKWQVHSRFCGIRRSNRRNAVDTARLFLPVITRFFQEKAKLLLGVIFERSPKIEDLHRIVTSKFKCLKLRVFINVFVFSGNLYAGCVIRENIFGGKARKANTKVNIKIFWLRLIYLFNYKLNNDLIFKIDFSKWRPHRHNILIF